jgi:hypothetical protein
MGHGVCSWVNLPDIGEQVITTISVLFLEISPGIVLGIGIGD